MLTAAEWAVLVAGRLTDLPPGFAAARSTPAERNEAVASLAQRNVLVFDAERAEPVPAVMVELEVLRRPLLTLRLDVTGRGGSRQGWFAVGSGLVAGVLTLPGGRVELSVAPDVRLGEELSRAVPEAALLVGPGFSTDPAGAGAAPAGRLPLALLDDAVSIPGAEPSADEVARADEVQRRTAGSLSCLVLGRAGGSVGAGEVSWLATDAGWVGLRPVLDGSPRRLVDLVPVQPDDLGRWVAPTVAALVEGAR
jgi:hypothetical protein